jgi:hypothetical protein
MAFILGNSLDFSPRQPGPVTRCVGHTKTVFPADDERDRDTEAQNSMPAIE